MGWIPKWQDEFKVDTANLMETDDWMNWRTTVPITPTPVSGGKAQMSLIDPGGGPQDLSIGGGVTSESHVPSPSEFDSTTGYRNKWTAVLDFYPVDALTPLGAHVAIFLRVNPTEWDNSPNQTRFGCYINARDRVRQGALQFTGDLMGSPDTGDTAEFFFDLSEDPFDNPTEKYRVQIVEEEFLSPFTGWTLEWHAEVWNLSKDIRIGWRDKITENVLKDNFKIAIPKLIDSKCAMGLGPGKSGQVDATQAATAYWKY